MKIQGQKKAAFALEVSIATVSDYVGWREREKGIVTINGK